MGEREAAPLLYPGFISYCRSCAVGADIPNICQSRGVVNVAGHLLDVVIVDRTASLHTHSSPRKKAESGGVFKL